MGPLRKLFFLAILVLELSETFLPAFLAFPCDWLPLELELELIQSQMAQKPMLRGEVGARAWRV